MLTTRKLIVSDQNSDVIVTGGGTLGVQFEGWNPFLANVNGSGSSTLFIQGNSTVKLAENFHSISDAVRVDIAGGSTFDLNGKNEGVGYISGAGAFINSSAAVNGFILDTPSYYNGADFSGVISGSGGVTLRGNGGAYTQIFSGVNNAYSGKTAIQNSSLQVMSIKSVSGGNSSMGAPTTVANGTIDLGNLTTAGTLKYAGTGDTTDRVLNLAGTTGSGTVDQSGTGLLKFTSAMTATGSGAKTLTLQGSTAGTGELAGGLVDSAGGATSLTKAGTGTWTLSGTGFTNSGPTTIEGGILSLQMGWIGTGFNSAITVNENGTLDLTSSITTMDNWLFDTAIAGTGNITKNGAGRVQVMNAGGLGGFSGTLTISDGVFGNAYNAVGDWTGCTADVAVDGSGVLDLRTDNITIDTLSGNGTVANTHSLDGINTLTLGADNGTNTFSGTIRGAGGGAVNTSYDAGVIALIKTGSGTQTLIGINTYTGDTTISGGTLSISGAGQLASGNYAGNIAVSASAALEYGSSADQILSGVISGDGELVKTNSGALTLTGPNTYTGDTTIDEGTLRIGGAGQLDSGNYAGEISIGAGATLEYGSSADQTLSGAISGAGALVKTNSGTLTLSGPNTYTGDTTISNGVLQLSSGASLSADTAIYLTSPGKLDLDGSITQRVSQLFLDGTALAAGTWGSSSSSAFNTDDTTFQGSGMLLVTVGTSGSSYTWDADGAAPLNDGGGTWASTGGNNWFDGSSYGAWGNTTADTAAIGTGNGAAGTIALSSAITLNRLTFNGAGSSTYTVSGNTLSFGGTSPAINVNDSATLADDNTVSFGGDNLAINLADGKTLTMRNLAMGSQNSSVTVSGGGTLALRFVVWNPFMSGVNGSGSSTLYITNGATVRLVQNYHTISDAVRVDIAAGSTLDLNGYYEGIGYLSGGGSIIHNGTAASGFSLDTPSYYSGTDFSGVLTGGGSVLFRGNNAGTTQKTQIFSGANTYTGSTVINNAGGNFTSGLQLRLANPSGAALQGSVTIGNNTGGAKGAVLLTTQPNQFGPSSVVTLNNASDGYSYFILNGNNQTVAGLSSVGASGQMLVEDTESGTVANAVLTINNSADYTYGGTIRDNWGGSGTMSLTKTGTGKQTLSGANTYTGSTTVSNGVLRLATGASLSAATTVYITSPGQMELDGGINQTVDQLWIDGIKQDAGTWGATESASHVDGVHFVGSGILTVANGPDGTLFRFR